MICPFVCYAERKIITARSKVKDIQSSCAQSNNRMFNTMNACSAGQSKIAKFDTLIMSFEVILCGQPILISLATVPQDVMQISEIQQSKTFVHFAREAFVFTGG